MVDSMGIKGEIAGVKEERPEIIAVMVPEIFAAQSFADFGGNAFSVQKILQLISVRRLKALHKLFNDIIAAGAAPIVVWDDDSIRLPGLLITAIAEGHHIPRTVHTLCSEAVSAVIPFNFVPVFIKTVTGQCGHGLVFGKTDPGCQFFMSGIQHGTVLEIV